MTIEAEWQAALESERLHHAWLLTGRPGLGKRGFAERAALDLVSGSLAVNDHPDIYVLTRAAKDDKEEKKRAEGKPFERKRNISVEQIRDLQRKLTTRPTLGDRRAIVIDPADDMERPAANALLKSLEEPPPGTFFFLVSSHAAKLLPTIRSRCRTLRFSDLSESDMVAALDEQVPGLDPMAHAQAIAAADGSPGRAVQFAAHQLAPAAGLLARLLAGEGRSLSVELSTALGARPSREKLVAFLALARSMLDRDLVTLERGAIEARATAMAELVRLESEAPILNYDPGLLIQRVASLLARAAPASAEAP